MTKKIGKKIDSVLDALFGNQIKGRWLKVSAFILIIVTSISIMLFIIFNVGYNKKDGFFIKPTEARINIDIKRGKQ